MRNPVRAENFAGRPRVVAIIVTVAAIGMAVLLLAFSSVLRITVADDMRAAVEQEAGEINRFAQTGIDPETGQAFTSGTRFMEVYLERQEAEPSELIIGGTVGQPGVIEQPGQNAPSFSSLDPATQAAVLEPNSGGTRSVPGLGNVSWSNVEVQAAENSGFVAVLAFHDQAEEEVRGLLMLLLGLGLIALAATGFAAWWAAGLILGHTREFRTAVDAAVAQRGTPMLPEEGSAEYVVLARSANHLLERAEEMVERERRYSEDITHELRTPLAVLEGGLSTAELTSEQGEHVRSDLLQEVRRLRLFLSDLVTLHRADRSDYVQAVTEMQAADIAEETVTAWEDHLVANDQTGPDAVRVVLGECEPGLRVRVDPPRLQQALYALVANARKASEPGSEVTVGVRAAEGPDGSPWASIEVVDTGRGIPGDERDLMMRRFARASNDPSPGAGMGLALADRLALAHGGALRIADHGENPGTTVSIDVPLIDEGQDDADGTPAESADAE